jgi:hypothetical protein
MRHSPGCKAKLPRPRHTKNLRLRNEQRRPGARRICVPLMPVIDARAVLARRGKGLDKDLAVADQERVGRKWDEWLGLPGDKGDLLLQALPDRSSAWSQDCYVLLRAYATDALYGRMIAMFIRSFGVKHAKTPADERVLDQSRSAHAAAGEARQAHTQPVAPCSAAPDLLWQPWGAGLLKERGCVRFGCTCSLGS